MRQQHGISLYTLLAAVVVLGVLTSVLVTSFTGNSSKAQAAISLMTTVAQAAHQFKLDTSCYPTSMSSLETQTGANAHNSCKTDIPEAQWHGPYITLRENTENSGRPGQSGATYTENFGPNAWVNVGHDLGYWDVHMNRIPRKLAETILAQCDHCLPKNATDKKIDIIFPYAEHG